MYVCMNQGRNPRPAAPCIALKGGGQSTRSIYVCMYVLMYASRAKPCIALKGGGQSTRSQSPYTRGKTVVFLTAASRSAAH